MARRIKVLFILEALTKKDDRVRPLYLSRNYGHQIALTCGLDNADGTVVISLDAICSIPGTYTDFNKKWEDGYEVVQTIRVGTEGVSWFKNKTSNWFYKLISKDV